MGQKKAINRELKNRYQKAKKKEKIMILDEFNQLTRYNRCYASQVLGKRKVLRYVHIAGERFKYVQDHHKSRRKKTCYYDQDVLLALKKIWKEADYICSKRLAPFLGEFIPVLEKHGEIKLTPKVKEKLFSIYAATIDRLLALTRNKQQIKGRSTTRPGSLLKKSIIICTLECSPQTRQIKSYLSHLQ